MEMLLHASADLCRLARFGLCWRVFCRARQGTARCLSPLPWANTPADVPEAGEPTRPRFRQAGSSWYGREGSRLDFVGFDEAFDADRVLDAIEQRVILVRYKADDAIGAAVRMARGGLGDPDELPDMECLFHQRLQHPGMR